MAVAGNAVSILGIVLWLVGAGWWVWFVCAQRRRMTVLRRPTALDLLSILSFVGLLVFAAGRALVTVAQRPAH